MSATTKLFMHSRGQAVRLPKGFRFEGTKVRVSKVGDKVILEPIGKQPIDFRVQRLAIDEPVGSTNQQELPQSFFENLLVPLVPLAEQRRIAARVDEHQRPASKLALDFLPRPTTMRSRQHSGTQALHKTGKTRAATATPLLRGEGCPYGDMVHARLQCLLP